MGHRFAGVALAAWVATAPGAQAVQLPDVQAVQALYKRSSDLTQALTQAIGGGASQLGATGDPQALDCAETLREASNQVSDQLMDLVDVTTIAANMHGGQDRRFAASMTRKAAARAQGILAVESRQVNQTAALCLTQAPVQTMAHDQIQFINDASAELGRLKARKR
jgi:hypothetical protein